MVIKKCNNFIKGMSEKTQVKLAQLMTFYVILLFSLQKNLHVMLLQIQTLVKLMDSLILPATG